jgi:hypothetical protein
MEELYEDLKDRAFNEGAFSEAAWNDLCEEIVAEKQSAAEIDDDVNWKGIVEALKAKYDDFREEVPVA